MNNQQDGFFFEIQQISDNSSLFDEFKKQKIYFSYFQVDHKYYLFFYSQKSIDINFIYQSVNVLQELDSKQRKIRSMRGFFLYALEILERGKDYEILQTNLPSFFWRKVKNIIRQNKKAALQEFLFGSQDSIVAPETQNHLNEKIERLQNQVNSLQDRIRDLETTLENSKYALSRTLKAAEATKIIQMGFRLNQEGKISLKKYYESTDPNSLFQSKGYSIKYESIRRTKLYQQLKPSNN